MQIQGAKKAKKINLIYVFEDQLSQNSQLCVNSEKL